MKQCSVAARWMAYISSAAFFALVAWGLTPEVPRHTLYALRIAAFTLLFSSSVFWSMAGLLRPTSSPVSSGGAQQKAYLTRPLLLLFGLASLVMIGHSLWMLGAPISVDESAVAMGFTDTSLWEILNPLRNNYRLSFNQNHTVVNVLSYLATLGDITRIRMRLPAIFLTLCFLTATYYFARGLTPFVALVIFLQIIFNPTLLYMGGMAKGYISAVLFAVLAFGSLLTFTRYPHRASKKQILTFFFAAFGCVLSHTFGALFVVTLIAALILWARLHRESFGEEGRKSVLSFVGAGIVLLPLVLITLLSHFRTLIQYNDVFHPNPVSPSTIFGGLLGYYSPAPKAVAFGVFLVFLAWSLGKAIQTKKSDFTTLVVFYAILTVGGLAILCQVRILHYRYFLSFLFPMLVWAANVVLEMPKNARRFSAAVLLLLIVFPLSDYKSVKEEYSGPFAALHTFWSKVGTLVDKDCVWVEGDPAELIVSRLFYLNGWQRAPTAQCSRGYLVKLPSQRFRVPVHPSILLPWVHVPNPFSLRQEMQEVYRDGQNRRLYVESLTSDKKI